MQQQKTWGFTLLEISIVLVIIGLVMGGILAGKILIHSAEIRALVAQPAQLDTAINTFQEKYNCLPGDCRNARDYGFKGQYGELDTNYSNGLPTDVNGNGDGKIYWGVQFPNGDGANESQNLAFQLNGAGLVKTEKFDMGGGWLTTLIPMEGKFSGAMGERAVWTVEYMLPGVTDSSGPASVTKKGNFYWGNGLYKAAEGAFGTQGVLIPADAFAVDQKIDDGLPRSGKILATGNQVVAQKTLVITADIIDSLILPIFDPAYDTGAAGAGSDFCVTNESLNRYNVFNESRAVGSLCSITIEAGF